MIALSEAEEALVARLARVVVERRLTVPAVLLLESTKPVSFLTGQTLHFFAPLVGLVHDASAYATATAILEDRERVELLLQRIESLEAAREVPPSPEGGARAL